MPDAGKTTPAGRSAQPRKRKPSPSRRGRAAEPAAPADDAPLRAFATLRDRPAIFVVLHEPIQPAHLLLLRREVGDRRFEELDFVIHSRGGDINTAYQMVQLIRQHTKRMNACVPLYAKSAATLWCLAANQIVMDESAELGPLDAQILEERSGGKKEYVSALNPFNTLERLQTFSLETLETATIMIVQRSGLDLNESLQHAIRFVGATTGPLFSKLDPEKLGRYSRALAVGMAYGERLLRRFSDLDEGTKAQILANLVRGYPSHDYIIDYPELVEMGMSVALFSDNERASVEALHDWILAGGEAVRLVEPANESDAPSRPSLEGAP